MGSIWDLCALFGGFPDWSSVAADRGADRPIPFGLPVQNPIGAAMKGQLDFQIEADPENQLP
jgi:hypothetical protein